MKNKNVNQQYLVNKLWESSFLSLPKQKYVYSQIKYYKCFPPELSF